ncbi:MAG: hypothetical protein ABSH05_15205 [Bryobacteraceae bacterium]|jgi:hypothetical protein
MRKVVRYMWVAAAAALLYLGWTFADRCRSSREFERARTRKMAPPAAPDAGSAVKILQFYASPGALRKGEQAILCYGVANAKTVRLEPEVEPVWPSLSRCLYVAPRRDTRYTLTAEGADGKRVEESFEIRVKPR